MNDKIYVSLTERLLQADLGLSQHEIANVESHLYVRDGSNIWDWLVENNKQYPNMYHVFGYNKSYPNHRYIKIENAYMSHEENIMNCATNSKTELKSTRDSYTWAILNNHQEYADSLKCKILSLEAAVGKPPMEEKYEK